MIKYDIKEQKELIQVYEEWEEELLRERELQENCLDYTRSFWQGEAAETMRGEMHAFFESGKFSRYLEQIKGIREVMEEAVPEMETLRQMCSDFPEALGKAGVKCESKSYIFVDLQELTKLNANMDDYINKMQETQNGLYRIMDMGRGVVDFGNLYEDVDEISIRIEQMRNLKAAINEYACRMQRLDAYLEMAYSRWVLEEQEEGTVQGEDDSSEYTENQAMEQECVLCGLSDFFYSGESCTTEELQEIVNAAYDNIELSQEEYEKLMCWITQLEHAPFLDYLTIKAEMQNLYESAIERSMMLNIFMNEEFFENVLKWNMNVASEELGNNFIEELKREMVENKMDDELSVILFLATITYETMYGSKLLELVGTNGIRSSEYTEETRGAGLIHLTGVTQAEFFKYLLENDLLDSDDVDLVNDLLSGFEEENSNYTAVREDLPSPAEYIADNYAIQSSFWFWTELEQAWIQTGNGEDFEEGEYISLNEFISWFSQKEIGNKDLVFLSSQYFVNGSGFSTEALYFMPLDLIRIMNGDIWEGLNNAEITFDTNDIGTATQITIHEITESGTETGNVITVNMPNDWSERYQIYQDILIYLNGGAENAQ